MRLNAHFGMLPMGAFEHCGDRRIKLQGGGGIPIVSDVVDVVSDVGQGVLDVVDDAGHFIDDAVNDVVPGGWYTVAAVATMNPELVGLEGATAAGTDYLGSMALGDATTGAVGSGATGFGINAGAAGVGLDTAAGAALASELGGLGETATSGFPIGDQIGDFPLEGSFGSPTAPGVQEATENLLSNNVLQETAGAPLDSIGDQPGDFPTEGSYGDPTAPGVKDAVQNLLDYNAQYATSGLSTSDALRAANQAKNLLTGSTATTGGLTSGLTGTGTTNPFDISGGIQNLTPTLTKANQDYELSGLPHMAAGSSTNAYSFTDLGNKDSSYNPFAVDKFSYIRPGLTQANTRYDLLGLPGYLLGKREGGSIPGHNPEFFSEGGLQHRYVKGQGDGTSDSVPAMLASGEFVIPADVVSGLGNGDNDAGAKVLDEFLRTIRQHKRRADVKKLPPDSKGPLGYLLEAKRKVR